MVCGLRSREVSAEHGRHVSGYHVAMPVTGPVPWQLSTARQRNVQKTRDVEYWAVTRPGLTRRRPGARRLPSNRSVARAGDHLARRPPEVT